MSEKRKYSDSQIEEICLCASLYALARTQKEEMAQGVVDFQSLSAPRSSSMQHNELRSYISRCAFDLMQTLEIIKVKIPAEIISKLRGISGLYGIDHLESLARKTYSDFKK